MLGLVKTIYIDQQDTTVRFMYPPGPFLAKKENYWNIPMNCILCHIKTPISL